MVMNNKTRGMLQYYILYNGIVFLISILSTLALFSRLKLVEFLISLLSGVVLVSISLTVGSKIKGRINTGGIIGLLLWILINVFFVLYILHMLSRTGWG